MNLQERIDALRREAHDARNSMGDRAKDMGRKFPGEKDQKYADIAHACEAYADWLEEWGDMYEEGA